MNPLTLLQPLTDWAATKAWFRPALAILTGVAFAVQQYWHNPLAQKAATGALAALLPLAAGSFGKSSSGLVPEVKP